MCSAGRTTRQASADAAVREAGRRGEYASQPGTLAARCPCRYTESHRPLRAAGVGEQNLRRLPTAPKSRRRPNLDGEDHAYGPPGAPDILQYSILQICRWDENNEDGQLTLFRHFRGAQVEINRLEGAQTICGFLQHRMPRGDRSVWRREGAWERHAPPPAKPSCSIASVATRFEQA
ncbi:unnamed protein product [Ectocarpus sp. 13 AM-2016]